MDFPDVINMFVSRMVVSCFGRVLLVCSICDRSAFMLIGIHFDDVFGLVDFTSKGGKVYLFLEICPELSAPSTWLVRSWVCVVPQGHELNFSSTKVDFI